METVLNSDGAQIQRMQSVLWEFKPALAKLKDRRQRTAERFNVFEALGIDEPAHSKFIAHLLNPKERHDQGDIFLTSFLECVGLDFCRSSTQDAEVIAEFNLDPGSRPDIYIRLADGQIILVENKIDAPEGDGLTQRLKDGRHDRCWEVRFDDDIFRAWSGFEIAWRNCQGKPRFAVRVESWDKKNKYRMSFGVTRNKKVTDNNLAEKEEALRAKLAKSGFSETTPTYTGLRFFNGMQLPGFGLSDAGDVLKLECERRNEEEPLTKQVVCLIWKLFRDFREPLEDLNHDYPYDDDPTES